MKRLIFATSNKDKVREIKEMTQDMNVEVLSSADIGFDKDVEENGVTFVDNAIIKAKAISEYIKNEKKEYCDAVVLADDSGLEIDYYDKAPGVYSHRWLGERTYFQAMTDVINDMKDVPIEKRGARFVCSMAAVLPDDSIATTIQNCEGVVGYKIEGDNGFGYDPFFFVPEFGCTTAQMTPEQKNEISHRGKALREMLAILKEKYFK